MVKRTPTVQPVGQRATGQMQPVQAPSAVGSPIGPRPVSSGSSSSSFPVQQGGNGFSNFPTGNRSSSRGGGTNIQVNMPDFDDITPFQDAVMEQYQRTTAPELEARRARMNQDLVNRGFSPGSEAYEREMDRFMRMENDLFNTAQRSALSQGLMAQNQMYNQGLGQAQINAGLRQANIAAQASRYGSDAAARASMYGSDQSREGALERLLAGLNQQESEFGRNFGLAQDQFGLAQDQANFGNLMDILGYGAGAVGQNNAALGADRQAAGGVLSNFLPGSPIIPINAGGAFNTTLGAQQSRANLAANNHNQFMGGIGSLGSAALMAFSDRNAKHDIKPVDNDANLEAIRNIPVSRWKYKADPAQREYTGPMAQDFGEHINGDPEARQISMIDAFGAALSGIQALADKLDSVTERLDAMESANAA